MLHSSNTPVLRYVREERRRNPTVVVQLLRGRPVVGTRNHRNPNGRGTGPNFTLEEKCPISLFHPPSFSHLFELTSPQNWPSQQPFGCPEVPVFLRLILLEPDYWGSSSYSTIFLREEKGRATVCICRLFHRLPGCQYPAAVKSTEHFQQSEPVHASWLPL